MNNENAGKPPHRPSLLQNWMSLAGLVIVIGGLFSFFLLFMLDAVGALFQPLHQHPDLDGGAGVS